MKMLMPNNYTECLTPRRHIYTHTRTTQLILVASAYSIRTHIQRHTYSNTEEPQHNTIIYRNVYKILLSVCFFVAMLIFFLQPSLRVVFSCTLCWIECLRKYGFPQGMMRICVRCTLYSIALILYIPLSNSGFSLVTFFLFGCACAPWHSLCFFFVFSFLIFVLRSVANNLAPWL